MEFGLNEILAVIDKVKSTELSLFEYQDADTKLKIKGTEPTHSRAVRRDGARADSRRLPAADANYIEGRPGAADANHTAGRPVVTGDNHAAGRQAVTGDIHTDDRQNGVECVQASAETYIISSPMVGTFYTAPSEGEAPYVRVGDSVKKGQTVGIVEAMKLMNEIESDADGVVEAVLADNEQMVEYGQPLVRIRKA